MQKTRYFSHPKHIYQEYLAETENKKHQDQALLRRWDFTKINRSEAQTPDGRYRLVSREYDVLNHIKLQNKDLYHTCLNYKSTPQKAKLRRNILIYLSCFHNKNALINLSADTMAKI